MRRATAPVLVVLLLASSLAGPLEAGPPSRPVPVPQDLFRPIDTRAAPSHARPEAPPIVDALPRQSAPARPTLPQAAPRPLAEAVAPRQPAAAPRGGGIAGQASWYCLAGRSACHHSYPDGPGRDLYAAAGPRLRAALGPAWRGRTVTVCAARCARVRLVDWCQCYAGRSIEKVIDLYHDAWAATGGGRVAISW